MPKYTNYSVSITGAIKRLREKHGWHFRMRADPDPTPSVPNIFVGSLDRGFGTSFWKIDNDMDKVHNDNIGLFFMQDHDSFRYAIELRQQRRQKCNSQHKIATLRLIEWIEAAVGTLPGPRRKVPDRVNYTVKIEPAGFSSISEMMNALEQYLKIFIPAVDNEINTLKEQFPEFTARRRAALDTEVYEKRLTVERSGGK
jgi:hypothetical protein